MTNESDPRVDELELRVQALELELERMRKRTELLSGSQAPTPAGIKPPLPPPPGQESAAVPAQSAGSPTAATDRTQRKPFVLESESLLKWGGVALVVLAVGFALSTAIRRGWIGPELQLAGAVVVSLALIVAGLRLRPTRRPWTHALCSGGIAALFTTVASDLFLDHTSDDVAFGCIAAIGLAGYGLARFTPSQWVGVTSLVGGMVGWLVIADGEPPFVATWVALVALVAVGLVLSLDRRWFALRFLAHGAGMFAIVGLAADAEVSSERVLVYVAVALLYGSMLRIPSIGDLTTPWQRLEIQLAIPAGPAAFAAVAVAAEPDSATAIGFIALALAVAMTGLGVVVRTWIKPAHLVSILIGASITLSIGFATLLSITAVFVALAVQGAGLVILSRAFSNSARLLVNAAIVLAIAALYAAGAMLDAWTNNVSIGEDIGNLAIIVAFAVAGWQTRNEQVRTLTAAAVLGGLLVWLGSVLVHLPQGQAVVSVSWAIVGTAVLVAGSIRKTPGVGAAGLAVLALTVVKLLTVDLREVDTLWRAGLFFAIGMGIMRLGFLLPRLTATAEDPSEQSDLEKTPAPERSGTT